MVRQRGWCRPYIGFNNLYAIAISRGKLNCNFECWTFSQIFNIGLKCQSITSHLGICVIFDQCSGALNSPGNFRVVDLAARPDQSCELRCGFNNEPRINSDAMTANARSGPQNIDPWMPIG